MKFLLYIYYVFYFNFLLLYFFIIVFFFFFNDTATTEIYTLSLHDALPISEHRVRCLAMCGVCAGRRGEDRKSTRLNSSHTVISYAVFCLKKKKKEKKKDIDKIKKKKEKIKYETKKN